MAIEEHVFPSYAAAAAAAYDVLDKARSQGLRPILLVPNYETAFRERRTLAERNCAFGVTVATPAEWLTELWQLFGDGRTLVSSEIRRIAIEHLAQEQLGKRATPGMIDVLLQAANQALCLIDTPAQNTPFAPSEEEAIALLRTYRDEIHARGLIEAAESYPILAAQAEKFQVLYAPVLLGCIDANLSVASMKLLEALNARVFDAPLPEPDETPRNAELKQLLADLYRRSADAPPVTPTGSVQIALASGLTAEQHSIADAVLKSARTSQTIAVAVPDPQTVHDYCVPLLNERSITTQLRERVRIDQTDLGRALLYLAHLVSDENPDTLLAADYALNPFASMWYGTAFYADKFHRGNRLIQMDEVLSDLAGHADPQLQGVIGLLEENDPTTAFDLIEAYAQAHFAGNPSYLSTQLRVLDRARILCEAADEWTIPWHEALKSLARTSISLHFDNTKARANCTVAFMTLQDMAAYPPASFDAVIIGHLNTSAYPVRDSEGSLITLLKKWEAAPKSDPLGAMRRTFFHAAATAHSTLILERALHNEKTDETQAAIVFEEVLICYQKSLSSTEDINRNTGIPQSLEPWCTSLGEQHLLCNAVGLEPEHASIALPSIGTISEQARNIIVLPRGGNALPHSNMNLSASQIESYLECPYQWFAKRRLKLENIEEGFGALERGSFIHLLLERFYKRFQEEVAPKVTTQTLPLASALIETVFAELAQEQYAARPGGRYVPIDALEKAERNRILPQLQQYLEFETTLLPTFKPWQFEWSYGETEPYTYAGCAILGRIDRIDVNDEGQAVIIDYKSSLSKKYRLHPKDKKKRTAEADASDTESFTLPSKMQALIYAKAVRDILGLNVVASLYVNPLGSEVYGAYDQRVLGPNDVPFTNTADRTSCAIPWNNISSFDMLLGESEKLVAQRMTNLAAGDIAPEPLDDSACKYCPVGNCPKRLAERETN